MKLNKTISITEEYKKVDNIKLYVQEQLNKGVKIIEAFKVTNVLLEEEHVNNFVTHSEVGEECTYINDSHEKSVKITSLNAKNQPRYNTDGTPNQYSMPYKEFYEMYEPVEGLKNIYKKRETENRFIQVNENIQFSYRHLSCFKLAKGGYINITNDNDYYGIQKKDFEETYILKK